MYFCVKLVCSTVYFCRYEYQCFPCVTLAASNSVKIFLLNREMLPTMSSICSGLVHVIGVFMVKGFARLTSICFHVNSAGLEIAPKTLYPPWTSQGGVVS